MEKKTTLSKEASQSPKPCCGCLGLNTMANVAARVAPAVVTIAVLKGVSVEGVMKTSFGSGTIINEDGTILSCAHLVVDKSWDVANKGMVDVTLQDGRSFKGIVVYANLDSNIAIVKIRSKTPLPTAKLGSSSSLRPSDLVVAMGCVLSPQNTITTGIVCKLSLGGMQREYLLSDLPSLRVFVVDLLLILMEKL